MFNKNASHKMRQSKPFIFFFNWLELEKNKKGERITENTRKPISVHCIDSIGSTKYNAPSGWVVAKCKIWKEKVYFKCSNLYITKNKK